ncbi:hypothetical protein LJC61_09165 [Ruminococcaceae bacterium OttesenSCG-928-A16]|nr:hypothetical protein [Ruminococcaceae bacterium OttesenSCG-928-A16]
MFNILGGGFSLYQVLWFFLLYSFIGWCSEVIFKSVSTGKFVNRGFLNGPVCPIYGFGAVAVVLLLHPVQQNLFFLFVGSVLVTSVLELITGYVLNVLFHTKWWDYSEKPLNIGGYICLQFSLVWGLACVLLIRVIHPLIDGFVQIIPRTIGQVLLLVAMAILLADVIVTVAAITKLNRSLGAITEIANSIHKRSDKLAESIGNTAISAADRINLEEQRQKLTTQLDESKGRVMAAVDEGHEKLNSALDSLKASRISRRLLKAFPNMQNRQHGKALEELKKRLAATTKPGKPNANNQSPPTEEQNKQ